MISERTALAPSVPEPSLRSRPPNAVGVPVALSFVVESEPVPMARPRVAVRGGRAHAYVPARTAQACWEIRQAAIAALGDQEPLSGPLSVTVTAYLRQPTSVPKRDRLTAMPTKRPDLDNLLKAVLDGCSPLWQDDAQVVELVAGKRYCLMGSPRWVIAVAPLGLAGAAGEPDSRRCAGRSASETGSVVSLGLEHLRVAGAQP